MVVEPFFSHSIMIKELTMNEPFMDYDVKSLYNEGVRTERAELLEERNNLIKLLEDTLEEESNVNDVDEAIDDDENFDSLTEEDFDSFQAADDSDVDECESYEEEDPDDVLYDPSISESDKLIYRINCINERLEQLDGAEI